MKSIKLLLIIFIIFLYYFVTQPLLFCVPVKNSSKKQGYNDRHNILMEIIPISKIKNLNEGVSDFEWLIKLANSIIARTPNSTSYNWDWGEGTLMYGMWRAYEVTGDVTYYNYIKLYIDTYVNEDGSINIDFNHLMFINRVCSGIMLLHIYNITHHSKYLIAATNIKNNLLNNWPKSSNGGFLHIKNRDQLWIDTLFMSCVFLVKLGDIIGSSSLKNEAVNQIIIHANKLFDVDKNLFNHGWDEDGSATWADPITHCSPCFWARGNGWGMMAIIEVLDYIPVSHPQKNDLINIFQKQIAKIIDYQDSDTGLWFTVVDQGSREGNYLETSASAIYVYCIKKGIVKNYLSTNYQEIVDKGNEGLNNRIFIDENGLTVVTGTSKGTAVGDYNYYINKETENNSLWGNASLLLVKSIICSNPTVFKISGSLKYYSNMNPIKDVILAETENTLLINNTNIAGYYEFLDLAADGSYTITPSKLVDTDLGDYTITTYDAALTAQAAVGIREFTSYEIIAADANKDAQIYTYDAALIAQYSVGLPRTSNSHVGEWVFNPANRSYQPLTSDQTSQDFTGIIIGNVHGGWNQPTDLTKNSIVFKPYEEFGDLDVYLDDEIIIPLKIKGNEEVLSANIDLFYDPDVLQFEDIIKTKLSKNFQLVLNNETGRLRVGLYTIEPLCRPGTLINLKFKVINESTAQKSYLKLEKFQLNNSVYMHAQSELNIIRENELPKEFSLSQNYPNPFIITGNSMLSGNDHTSINYKISKAGKASIIIYNYLGQKIKSFIKKEMAPGSYIIHWDGRNENGELISSGIYYYRLVIDKKTLIRKMIVL